MSYLDSTPGNIGILYRMSDNADVDVAWDNKGSFVIGWTKAGEWLEYTVNVASTDIYTLSTWVGAPATGGIFHWEIDGLAARGFMPHAA